MSKVTDTNEGANSKDFQTGDKELRSSLSKNKSPGKSTTEESSKEKRTDEPVSTLREFCLHTASEIGVVFCCVNFTLSR